MKPGLCIFKNSSDERLLPRQILRLGPLVCKKVTIVQITLKFIPTFTDQTYILLTHCIPVRLSRNSHIWYPGWRRHHVLIKYSQKYNFFVFVFNLTEVETAALKIFCVMIPSLVYTCRDFGLFRVVRPYIYRNVYVVVNFFSAWDEASSCSEQYIFWIKYIL